MTNEEWRQAYRQGYRDGRDDADKKMNYTNFPPVYYGGADSQSGTSTGGLSYSMNESKDHFVTGMSLSSSDC